MKMFDAGKTRMIGLPYGQKNYDNMLSRFRLIPERNGQTDGQTDGQIWGGGAENAGVENARATKYEKPSEENTLK